MPVASARHGTGEAGAIPALTRNCEHRPTSTSAGGASQITRRGRRGPPVIAIRRHTPSRGGHQSGLSRTWSPRRRFTMHRFRIRAGLAALCRGRRLRLQLLRHLTYGLQQEVGGRGASRQSGCKVSTRRHDKRVTPPGVRSAAQVTSGQAAGGGLTATDEPPKATFSGQASAALDPAPERSRVSRAPGIRPVAALPSAPRLGVRHRSGLPTSVCPPRTLIF